VAQPAAVSVIATANSTSTGFFTVPSSLVANAPFACAGTFAIANANGTYTVSTQTLSSLGLSCGTFSTNPSVTNGYSFTITTSGVTTASLELHNPTVYAALLGAPFLLLFGLLPGLRRHRNRLLAVLSVALLAIALLPVAGCGSGGFTRTTTSIAQQGNYLILITDAHKDTVAEVPVVVGSF
jgi:hypothetical protein